MTSITIIGGGASGTLLAVNLIKYAREKAVEINVVERKSRLNKGVAYGTPFMSHLLNVPANKMGALHDDIAHFYRWLSENDHSCGPDAFIPRSIFGRYIGDLLEKTLANAPSGVCFNTIDDEAADLSIENGKARISLASGNAIISDHVALAFGNALPDDPDVTDQSFTASPKYFRDQWDARMYESIRANEDVFIIGTGLSMIDVLMQLAVNGHTGKITAVSTHGLLPAAHDLGHTYPLFADELRPMKRVSQMLRSIRRHIKNAENTGSNWRAVIDSLRPATQDLWFGLPLEEKRKFDRRLSRFWNVARHRMPHEAAAVVDEMKQRGQLDIIKGRVKEIAHDGRFEIVLRKPARSKGIASDTDGNPSGSEGVEIPAISADVIINCTGSQTAFTKIDSTLIQNLIRRGIVRNDALNMGLDATRDGSIISANGQVSETIHTLSTALKGILWESTAIPEIRVQAHDLALKLLAS